MDCVPRWTVWLCGVAAPPPGAHMSAVEPEGILRDPVVSGEGAVSAVGMGEEYLYAGYQTGGVAAWSLETRRVAWRCDKAHEGGVIGLCVCDELVFSHGRDGWVVCWTWSSRGGDAVEMEEAWRVEMGTINFCGVSAGVMAGGLVMVAAGGDDPGSVVVWKRRRQASEGEGGGVKMVLGGEEEEEDKLGMCMCVAVSTGAGYPVVFGGYENGSVVGWDPSGGRKLVQVGLFPWGTEDPIMAMDVVWMEEGREWRGVAGCATPQIGAFRVWESEGSGVEDPWGGGTSAPAALGGKVGKTRSLEESGEVGVSAVAIRGADGKIVAVGGVDGSVLIFSVKKLKPLAGLEYHTERIPTLAFGPRCGGGKLASADAATRIAIWPIYPTL